MCRTPLYVPAGKVKPVVSILRLSESVRVALMLNIKINWLNTVRLLPAAYGPAPVKAVKAPPFTLPATFAEGILSAAPSVRAAPEAVKYAYSFTKPMKNGRVQVVVILTGVLPMTAPFRTRGKLTTPGAAVIVMAVLNWALRFTFATLEFNWALPLIGINASTAAAKARVNPLRPAHPFCAPLNLETTFLSLESGNRTHPHHTEHNDRLKSSCGNSERILIRLPPRSEHR